jgi:hypothetical protein
MGLRRIIVRLAKLTGGFAQTPPWSYQSNRGKIGCNVRNPGDKPTGRALKFQLDRIDVAACLGKDGTRSSDSRTRSSG